MRSPATTTILGLLALSTLAIASIWLVGGAGGPEPQNDRAVLAWIRFVDGEETYAGVPYLWLGKVDIELQIDVNPDPGHVLEILWGSKSDPREAVATVNGNDVRITGGGYDGFRWLSVPVSPNVTGTRYEITFLESAQKPAFLAEVRLTEKRTADSGPAPDLEQPASKIACTTAPLDNPVECEMNRVFLFEV
ncbi:MAG TPA: hypothetical protein VMY37_33815 [Thermoguttaceae bacterium]|nr:hypothetical protein [Thermoguttaceae bacterium]